MHEHGSMVIDLLENGIILTRMLELERRESEHFEERQAATLKTLPSRQMLQKLHIVLA